MTACSRHRSILVRKLSRTGKPQFTHQCQKCLKIDRKANGGTVWVKAPPDPSAVPPWVNAFDDGEQLLFPIAPEGAPEDVKMPRSHHVEAEAVADEAAAVETAAEDPETSQHDPYIAPLNGHVKCPSCGEDHLDIEEVRKKDNNLTWLLRCSWNCGLGFVIKAIPGVLSADDGDGQFRLRDMWRPDLNGLTIPEAYAKSPDVIRALARKHRSPAVQKRIREFLETQG